MKITRLALTGNDAGAYAFKAVNPDVAAVFPITPQTEMMHKFADFVNDGEVDTELILVESEHSAMSACVGSCAAGARTITATSSNGYALMFEILYIAASTRLPIVMAVINRALSGPINIHNDHSDTMGGRDTGWIQIFSENAQEVYDNVIQSFRIAEHKEVLTPTLATLDGFIISHTTDAVEIMDDETVQNFVGEYDPHIKLLDTDHPMSVGPLDLQDYYFEHKKSQSVGILNALKVVKQVGEEFGKLTGRYYDFFEKYRLDDAEIAFVALGSVCGTTKVAIDQLREEGKKVGLLKIRLFRPFPYKEIREALKHVKIIGILDRSDSFGAFGGPVFSEIRSTLYGLDNPPLVADYICGLGGRDIALTDIITIFKELESYKEKEPKELVKYYGVRDNGEIQPAPICQK